jgi:Ferritin-like
MTTTTASTHTVNLRLNNARASLVNPLAAAQIHAQVAVAVELYTIPYYLSALASIKDTKSPAYAPVLSVCTEEMMHLQLAANMCLALGTTPNFTAPVYGVAPAFPNGTPVLDPTDPATGDSGILNASIANLVDALPTMLDIEVPTEFESGALVPPYHSIGQLYDALMSWARLARNMAPWSTTNQVSNVFAAQPFTQTIASYADLVSAVEVICEQGEGKATSPPPSQPPPFSPDEFMITDVNDRLVGANSDPSSLSSYAHFGRFLMVRDLNLSSADVYSGTAAPSSAANLILQQNFAALITTLNAIWGGASSGGIWAMTSLLGDAAAVWQAGNIPQWTPVSS